MILIRSLEKMFFTRGEPLVSMVQNLTVLSVEQVTRHEGGRAPGKEREG